MNFFRFFDDIVSGTILLPFEFVRTTWTIFRHPLIGLVKLTTQASSGQPRIGSLTYLVVTLLIANVLWSLLLEAPGFESTFLAAISGAASGTTSGIIAPLAAALVGAAAIGAIARFIAWLTDLSPAYAIEFVARTEFGCGALLLGYSIGLWAIFQLHDPGDVGALMLVPILTVLVGAYVIFVMLIFFILSGSATRDPRLIRYCRLLIRGVQLPIPRTLHGARAAYRTLLSDTRRLLIGPMNLRRDGRRTVFSAATISIVAFPLPLYFLTYVFSLGTELTSKIEQSQTHEGKLEVYSDSCTLSSDKPFASAAIWNHSDKPADVWLGELGVWAIFDAGNGADRRVLLDWEPQFAQGKVTQFLLPGQVAEVSGPIRLKQLSTQLIRKQDYVCNVAIDRDILDLRTKDL